MSAAQTFLSETRVNEFQFGDFCVNSQFRSFNFDFDLISIRFIFEWKGKSTKLTDISDIVGGKMDFNLKVSVINMWTTPDRGNPTQQGSIHMILIDEKLANDEEDAAYVETVCELATQKQLETIEGVDSSKIAVTVSDVTPTSKSLGKAIAESVESLDDIELGGCDASSTKEPKLRCDSPNKCEVVAVDPVVAWTKDSLGKRAADIVVPVVDVD